MGGSVKWSVKVTDELAEALPNIPLTEDDRLVIRKWTQTIIEHGPQYLQTQPSVWADHELHQEWAGYRASSFSSKGRIIYKVENGIVTVTVVRITPNHDYNVEEKNGKRSTQPKGISSRGRKSGKSR